MPTFPTLLDMAKRKGRDRAVPLISETSKWIPEVTGKTGRGKALPGVGTVRTIKGQSYKTLVRTTNPTVGFRDANQGVASSVSAYENRTVETFILNPRWECDKAVADASEDGPDLYIADEAAAIMEAAMQLLGIQFFYGRGTNGHAKGHPGLVDSVIDTYTHTGGGSAGDTGSVYFVKFGVGDVCWVYGENGKLEVPDKRIETIYRTDEGDTVAKGLDGYVQSMLAYPGLQVGSVRSIGRLKLVGDAGHTLTDDLLYETLAKLDMDPDVVFMPKTLLEQLRSARTTFNESGKPADLPEDVCGGIPIAVTQSLTMTE